MKREIGCLTQNTCLASRITNGLFIHDMLPFVHVLIYQRLCDHLHPLRTLSLVCEIRKRHIEKSDPSKQCHHASEPCKKIRPSSGPNSKKDLSLSMPASIAAHCSSYRIPFSSICGLLSTRKCQQAFTSLEVSACVGLGLLGECSVGGP